MRKLVLLHQTLHTKKPSYLYYILTNQLHTNPRLAATLNLKNIHCKTTKYNKSYFPSTILDWNNLPFELKSVKSKKILKSRFLNKIRPKKSLYVDIRNNDKVRYLTMLRLNLSPLRAHKFKYNFEDTPHPYCAVCETI